MTDNSKTSIACCDSHTQLMAVMTYAHIQATFSWGLLGCLFYTGRVKDIRKGMSVRECKSKSEQRSQIASVHWIAQRGPFQRGLLDFTVLSCKKKKKKAKSLETKLYVSEST